jgi:hypothetical protein
MRRLGIVLLAVGALVIVLGLSIDSSVSTGFGRLNNVKLMEDKGNYLIVGSAFVLAGLGVALFARRGPG